MDASSGEAGACGANARSCVFITAQRSAAQLQDANAPAKDLDRASEWRLFRGTGGGGAHLTFCSVATRRRRANARCGLWREIETALSPFSEYEYAYGTPSKAKAHHTAGGAAPLARRNRCVLERRVKNS